METTIYKVGNNNNFKITKLEISNFRNINHVELIFNNQTSILTGANGIGKSNALNGINWLITNTLLTDKWGTGENDLDSVFPKNYIKGQNPSVTITLESGVTFTKKYVKGKSGNTAEYYINNVKEKSQKDFEASLFKELNFEKKLKCEKEVKELRLFTDPLYPLQKLDPKALRMLLVELGCSVTNEEVFELNKEFEPLKEYAPKFQDDYTKMRIALKAERAELNKQLDSIPFMLESYKGPDFKPEIRADLEVQKQELIQKINSLKGDDAVKELKKELESVEQEKENYIAHEQSKIDLKLTLLEEKKKIAESNATSTQNEELKAINGKIQDKNETLTSLNDTKKAYADTRAACRQDAEKARIEIAEATKKKGQLEDEILEVKKRDFKGYVTCPECGHTFAADTDAEKSFNKQKQDDIANLELQCAKLDITLKEQQKRLDEAWKKGIEAKDNEELTDKKIENLKAEIEALNKQKTSVVLTPVDRSKAEAIESEISELEGKEISTQKFDSKIDSLKKKIKEVEEGTGEAIKAELEDLSSKLEEIEEKIKEQYTIESNEKARNGVLEKQDEIVFGLNEKDYLIELVNKFIQTKIKLINNKAKELTGLDFVMLEENITNDGVKEVCYATVDGVEFGNVNTSQKLEVGIKFIETIKKIIGHNDLPILADRLEGFDDIEKIKNLTTEQLICTVVGNKDQKEIVII